MAKNAVLDAMEGVTLSEADLVEVVGGIEAVKAESARASASAGYICSLSAECNSGGRPACNPFYW